MPRILHHIDLWDGEPIPEDYNASQGLFQRCDPIESNDGRTGLRYYFIKEVPEVPSA